MKIVSLFMGLALLCLHLTTFAQDRYWFGGTSTDWHTAANWSSTTGSYTATTVPGTGDAVVIGSDALDDCALTAVAEIGSLDITGGASLDLAGYAFTVNGSILLTADDLLCGSGNVTVDGNIYISGGTFESTSATLSVGEGMTDEVNGFVHSNGTVQFIDDGMVDVAMPFYDVVVDAGATLNLSSSLGVGHSLDLDGQINASGGPGVFMFTNDPAALTGSGGVYLTFGVGGIGAFAWAIGEAEDEEYVFPLIARSGEGVTPIEVYVDEAGTGAGLFGIATLGLDDTKTENVLPGTQLLKADGTSNADYNLNRVYSVASFSYTELPVVTYEFYYNAADLYGISVTEANLKAQFFDPATGRWSEPMGTVDTGNDKVTVATQTATSGFWMLVDETSPNYTSYGGKTGLSCAQAIDLDGIAGPITFLATDTVFWLTFTAELDTSIYIYPGLFGDTSSIDSMILFYEPCGSLTRLITDIEPLIYSRELTMGTLSDSTYTVKLYSSAVLDQNIVLYKQGERDWLCDPDSLITEILSKTDYTDTNFCGNYSPQAPLRIVNVNFHFLLKNDGSGNFNEYDDGKTPPNNTWNGYNVAYDYLADLNRRLRNNQNYQYVFNGALQAVPALPTKIQARIYTDPLNPADKGVYFHRSDIFYSPTYSAWGSQLKNELSVHGDLVIDIFFTEDSTMITDSTVGISGIAHSKYVQILVNNYQRYSASGNHGERKNTFIHEFAHNLGLGHTAVQIIKDDSTNCQADICSDTPDSPCYSKVGNNVMNYGENTNFFTLCQLGIVHSTLTSHSATYINGDDCENHVTITIAAPDSTVWDETKYTHGDVVIDSGAVLNIQCTTYMLADAKIIVKPGGKLIIDGGHLRRSCLRRWRGIEVWGIDTLAHPSITVVENGSYPSGGVSHGVVIMKNHATIEGAETGILTCKRDSLGYNDLAYSGGIVLVKDSSLFTNTEIGLYFAPFPQKAVSRVENSTFNFAFENAGQVGVVIYDVNGVTFDHCSFQGPEINSNFQQFGIFVFDGKYTCTHSKFEALYMGIADVQWSPDIRTTKILDCLFSCGRGVVLSGTENISLLRNTFSHNNSKQIRGIELWGSNQFVVKENFFSAASSSSQPDGMLYCKNSGLQANEIRLNQFSYFGNTNGRSFIAAGNNSGLKFRCNDFKPALPGATYQYTGNIDIYGPIAELQGLCGNNSSPANNYFADVCGFTSTTGTHIFTNPGVPHFDYRYLDNGSRFEPENACIVNQNFFAKIGCQVSGPDTNYCPDTYGPIRVSDGWVANTSVLNGVRDVIDDERLKLDNGQTAGLVGYAKNGTEADVLDSLDAIGGMLSDDVLLALLHRTPAVDEDRLAHILITNAPHSNLLWMSLNEMTDPIPTDSMTVLLQCQDSTSLRKPIIDSLGYFTNELELAYNALMFIIDEDDYTTYTVDSVIAQLETEPEYLVNLQMKLANLYMANGQYTEAEDVLDGLPVYYNEVQQFKNLRYMQLDLLENNETIEDLNGDELGILGDIAESNTQAGWQAKAILIALGEDTIPFDIEDRIYASPKRSDDITEEPEIEVNVEPLTNVKVYPNPATNTITLEYIIAGDNVGETVFTLYGLIGSESLSVSLAGNRGSRVIDISALHNGVYLYQVVSQNKKLCQDKLVIVR